MTFTLGDAVDAVEGWLDNISDFLTGDGYSAPDAQDFPGSPQQVWENFENARNEEWWDSHGTYVAGHRVSVTRSDSNYYEVTLTSQANNTEDTFYMPRHASGWTLTGIVYNGTTKNDAAVGMHYHDVLRGAAGSDILMGEGGNDTLDGGGGADRLHGGSSTDTFWSGTGADRMYGGSGDDQIHVNDLDWTNGNAGNDNFYFADGDKGMRVGGAVAAQDDFDFVGGNVHVTAVGGFAVNAVSGGFRLDGSGWYDVVDGRGTEVRITFKDSPRFYESFEDAMELRWEPIQTGFIDLI